MQLLCLNTYCLKKFCLNLSFISYSNYKRTFSQHFHKRIQICKKLLYRVLNYTNIEFRLDMNCQMGFDHKIGHHSIRYKVMKSIVRSQNAFFTICSSMAELTISKKSLIISAQSTNLFGSIY